MRKRIALTLLSVFIISSLSLAQVPVDISIIDEKSDYPIDYPLYRIREGETNKMGFVDKKGRELIRCQFDFAQPFVGDSAFVRDNKTRKWGIINKWGILVMPYQFDAPFAWNNDCFKYSFIEKHNDCIFEKEDFGIAGINGKLGFINRQGKWLVPPQYEAPLGRGIVFKNGYAAASKNKKVGLINRKGALILPFIYDFIGLFNNGLINVGISRNGFKSGCVNLKNEVIIPFIYQNLSHFEDGFAVAAIMVKNELSIPKTDSFAHITNNNLDLNSLDSVPINDDSINIVDINPNLPDSALTNSFDGFADDMTQFNLPDSVQRYGFIDTTGKVVIPFQYDAAMYANDGLFAVKEAKNDNKWGFVNAQHQVVIPFQFDFILTPFIRGVALVTKMTNGVSKYFPIDKMGKCIKDCP